MLSQKMLELGEDSDSQITVLVDVRAQDGLANPPGSTANSNARARVLGTNCTGLVVSRI